MPLSLAFAAALMLSGQEGPMVTAPAVPTETAEQLRTREAMAYAYPTPPGVPTDDFGFLNYCHGLIDGHVRLGETLSGADAELMRLGRLERQDFATAIATGAARRDEAEVEAARAAYDRAMARWEPYLQNTDADARQSAFDLFFGLPGRCEHAARRVRDNITTAPATLEQVGLTPEEVLPPTLLEAQAEAEAERAASAAEEAAAVAEATASDESPATTPPQPGAPAGD